MKLQNHPKLQGWPPDWHGAFDPKKDRFLVGVSEGTLAAARLVPGQGLEVTAEWNGSKLFGTIESDDEDLLKQVVEELKKNIGKPLSEIGALEVGA